MKLLFEIDEELEKRSNPFSFAAWMSCTRNVAWFTKRNGENEVASAFYRSIGMSTCQCGAFIFNVLYIINSAACLCKINCTIYRSCSVPVLLFSFWCRCFRQSV